MPPGRFRSPTQQTPAGSGGIGVALSGGAVVLRDFRRNESDVCRVASRTDSAGAGDEEATAGDEWGSASGLGPVRWPRYALRPQIPTATGDGWEDDPDAGELTAFHMNDLVVGVGTIVRPRMKGPAYLTAGADPVPVYEFGDESPHVFLAQVSGSADYGEDGGGHFYSWEAIDGSGREGQENATALLVADEVDGAAILAGTKVYVSQVPGQAVFKLWRLRPVGSGFTGTKTAPKSFVADFDACTVTMTTETQTYENGELISFEEDE